MKTGPWNRALAFLLALGLSSFSIAETPKDGQVAYDRGDYPTALRIWGDLANQGVATAQVRLGLMYARGHGTPRDDVEAVRWYRKAAEQGFAWGQTNLGYMFAQGRGVAKDDAEAVQWYVKAAGQEFAMAQDNLGVMYRDGRGVMQDPAVAVDWFRKASANGYADGQNNLGWMYAQGSGVTKDDAEAVIWYRKAAEQGNVRAQTNLAYMYEQGRGVVTDDAEAARWYRKAAEQGNANAQTKLGYQYETGRGVAKDETEAAVWYRKAAEQGDARAKTLLAALEKPKKAPFDLSHTVAALVKANEGALPALPPVDAERARIARAIIETARTRELLAAATSAISGDSGPQESSEKISPELLNALKLVYRASFQPDLILPILEHKLAESLDPETLQIGLQWERSDLGRRIVHLEVEANKPERLDARREFNQKFKNAGGTPSDDRARACGQADILANEAGSYLPIFEALVASGLMSGGLQQSQPLDMAMVGTFVVMMRPVLREAARQLALASCLFDLRDLTDAEFEQRLEFLRSDSGGRYARGMNTAMRDALLQRAEVFTRTMLEVTRTLKQQPNA